MPVDKGKMKASSLGVGEEDEYVALGSSTTRPSATDFGAVSANEDGKSQQRVNASSSESTSQPHRNSKAEWWAVILSNGKRGVKEYDVRVKEDTGTPINWIHPDVVRSCKLDSLVEDCEPRFFRDMNGKTFKCEKRARVTWYGRKQNSLEDLFFVAPEKSPIQLVLGDEFVTKYGRASEVCADAPKTEDARMFVATKITKEQRRQMEENSKEHKKQSAEVIARSQKPAGESRRKGNSSGKKRDS